jgi:hypothetical protein
VTLTAQQHDELVEEAAALAGFAAPELEPTIEFGLARAPDARAVRRR